MFMYYVYVLESLKTGRYYIGSSANINERLKEHNSGDSFSTRNQRLWKVIYTEQKKTQIEARRREKFFKTGDGRRVLKNFLGEKS